jgi:tetratricopeptide (TPR) repeat protein
MNRICAMLVVGLLAGPAANTRAGWIQEPEPSGVAASDFARWIKAVAQHTPGADDEPVRMMKPVSREAFQEIREALGKRRRELWWNNPNYFNRLLLRAAVLHMDVAVVLADEVNPTAGSRPARPSTRRTAPSRRDLEQPPMTVLASDGEFHGLEAAALHWEFGRILIDGVEPQPSEDRLARLWYLSAAAIMANRSLLADLNPHLEKARKLFPADPDILFASGCYYETIASPRVRPVIDSATLPPGVRIMAPSRSESWRRAEEYFRRAVEGRPDFAAARVRHGRALDMIGRHDAAIQTLGEAASGTSDTTLLYWAALFEGAAQESLGNTEGARTAYERAAALFPNSQSPSLALSRIAWERGDRTGALAAAARVFGRRARGEMDDPWWTYHLWLIRDSDETIRQLREPFMPEAPGR